ncbi:uncharacterized protein LOC101895274 [Musca domestica]|uniref:Uncharacterized protein LOC101895274 n=1 Tax=Musca domestica TaxID=7370 RepID=A0A9J7CZJ8_MUSDO|nr:uncharacterized protein LOC101895274 [Musca domestica]
MSEIYDYVYGHTMAPAPQQQQSSNESGEETLKATTTLTTTISQDDSSNSESEIDVSQFSSNDLQIFVDSLETIARLERAKHNRKLRHKHRRTHKKRQVTCLDSSTCSSIHEEDLESGSDEYSSDEDLFDDHYLQLPVQGQSTALYSNLNVDSSITSDSEDSGVFVIERSRIENHVYENIPPLGLYPTNTTSNSKSKSLKMRLYSLIKRKHESQKPSVEILSSTKIGELSALNADPKKKSKKSKLRSLSLKSDNKLLEKAMRLLTL